VETTYILTAELDDNSFAWLDGLRREHFPPERNFLPAHLTLFHRLSLTQVANLRFLEVPSTPIPLHFDQVIFLGFGVAFRVQSADLERLRYAIQTTMGGGEFSRQDRQPWKPHVTIQNKESAETARALQRKLLSGFSQRAAAVTGLRVWEYLHGPWRLARRIAFPS
jgi:hypothetical protein